jgi:UDP-N-acetylmuramyl pentapeptide phosphotransferase/UDP-N-acetylglucosamine-1-phosphate transferase
MLTYIIIAVLLLAAELVYFRIADKYNIIDKPNERSSHKSIVLRGGGVIFTLSMIAWAVMMTVQGSGLMVQGYLPFIIGLVMISGISFIDDIRSLPDSVRLVVQFISMGLMIYQLIIDNGQLTIDNWWGWALFGITALIVCVGATNIINFMDGINGITAGYSLAVLVPLLLVDNGQLTIDNSVGEFIEPSYLIVAIIGVLVFSWFNFRPRGKAKCFAGDVGSVGIAFIMLFAIGKLIVQTGDITYLIFLLVYGVDGVLTIFHRIMLHENLGEAHRKHAYQLMANELKMSHVTVSLLYMAMQLAVSLGFIYLCPNTVAAHWIYFIGALLVLSVAYVLFKMKYYHLHEEYLAQIAQVRSKM